MIGDLIIFIKRFVRQQITCRHDYRVTYVHDYRPNRIGVITGISDKKMCCKCYKFKKDV
jgi:hypothetical protein